MRRGPRWRSTIARPPSVEAAIDRLGGGPRLRAAPADLAMPEGPALAVAQAAAAFGRLDILINNAAVNIERPIETTDDAHWDLHLDVDLRAPFFAAQAALPLLRASKGSIVNIASELGLHAVANNVAYVTAKHGLVALTRALAVELAPAGIRVNAVCPGAMDTELMRRLRRGQRRSRGLLQELRDLSPPGPAGGSGGGGGLRPRRRLAGRVLRDRGGARYRRRQHGGARVMEDFRGKRVLVTGSARGIGLAAARLFLERGATLLLHGPTAEALAPALAELAPAAGDRRRSRRPGPMPAPRFRGRGARRAGECGRHL